MRRTLLTLYLLPAMLSVACIPVNPVPGPSPADAAPPSPSPEDALADRTFDCQEPWVSSEHEMGGPLVEACLTRDNDRVTECLSQTAAVVHPDTVGCEVQDLGMQVASKVAAGTATPVEVRTSERIRSWIRSGNRSFR